MEYEFYAFISYKRGENDERWAQRLQRTLERYRVPVADLPIGGAAPKRLKVFRDKSDLEAYQTVGQGLSDNLASSRFLVVVCSPRSAQSPYVDAEARHFVETGRKENIVPFVIKAAGEPASFYSPLIPAGMEPVIASENFEETFVRLLSRLLGVEYDSMWQAHLQASRREALFRFAAVAAVIILVAGFALWAIFADRRATEKRIRAEEIVDFMTFDLQSEIAGLVSSAKRSAITERVNSYYERWEPGEPRTLYARAVNLDNRGLEMFLAHDNARASENYLAALKAAEGLWDG